MKTKPYVEIFKTCLQTVCLQLLRLTVKFLYNGHHRDLEKVSAMRRCPLYRGLTFSKKNDISAEKNVRGN